MPVPMFSFLFFIGTLFATGALDGTVVIWSMNSLTMVKRFECIEDEGYDFTMSSPVSTTSSSSTQAGSVPVTHIMTLCEVRITCIAHMYMYIHVRIIIPMKV